MSNPNLILDAIEELRPGSAFVLRGDVLEWLDEYVAAPTQAEIDAKVAEIAARKPTYRALRKAAYITELGKDARPAFDNTVGDVLDVLIAQIEAMRQAVAAPALPEYAEVLAKIAAIKARYPKPQE